MLSKCTCSQNDRSSLWQKLLLSVIGSVHSPTVRRRTDATGFLAQLSRLEIFTPFCADRSKFDIEACYRGLNPLVCRRLQRAKIGSTTNFVLECVVGIHGQRYQKCMAGPAP